MKLALWNPWYREEPAAPSRREDDVFDDFLRPFGGFWYGFERPDRPVVPAADVIEKKDKYVVKADLPGIEEKDIQVEVRDGALSIGAERSEEKEHQDGAYRRLERKRGSFRRSFYLGDDVDVEKIKAKYKNGTLTVTLPKSEKVKPHTVKVETN